MTEYTVVSTFGEHPPSPSGFTLPKFIEAIRLLDGGDMKLLVSKKHLADLAAQVGPQHSPIWSGGRLRSVMDIEIFRFTGSDRSSTAVLKSFYDKVNIECAGPRYDR